MMIRQQQPNLNVLREMFQFWHVYLRLCLQLDPIENQGLMNPAEMRGRLWRHLF
jgi:hypothetical protein